MFHTFEGIENVRDLGGLTREDGARVRENVLFRTGRLSGATDEDIRRLEAFGVSCVMDFRDLTECRREPDRDIPGASWQHLPALPDLGKYFKPVDDPTYTAAEVHDDFRRIYRYLALTTEAHTAYTRFFELLLASEGRPVLWHCTQGKDRTGVAALLLLTALGFDEETIVREYMLTNDYMGKKLAELSAGGFPFGPPDPVEREALSREIFLVFEENIRFYISCVQMEYGSLAGFSEIVLGVGPREIRTLERYYLE